MIIAWSLLGIVIPDKLYLRVLYRLRMNKRLNLKDPHTFSEKLQWLKLYDRNPDYVLMVDKYAVKQYVAKIIGEKYIIPTIGVWRSFDEIDFNQLPNSFVLKCTHDSGGVVICKDKTKLNIASARKKLNKSLKHNYYWGNREWPYKQVPRRIIAEMYIEPSSETNDLPDYKFFCFNGVPMYCQVITGRNKAMCIDFFDKDWNHQPFHEPYFYPFAKQELIRPSQYELMWSLAQSLAQDKPFSRIDFYQVNDCVFFGEITFYPTSGMGGFNPEKFDLFFGNLIELPHQDTRVNAKF